MSADPRVLPADVAGKLVAMRATGDRTWAHYVVALRRRGYTLQSIADALGVSRQRVHVVERTAQQRQAPDDVTTLPMPPRVRGSRNMQDHRRELRVEDSAMVRGLWDMSSTRRGPTPEHAVPARASVALTTTVRSLLGEGYSLEDIAASAGIDGKPFRNRMLRAGVRARKEAS